MRLHYVPELDYDFPPDDGPTDADLDAYYEDMQSAPPPGQPSSEELIDMAQQFADNPF
jgi:hypothetical protein